jgi:hypothetical protein
VRHRETTVPHASIGTFIALWSLNMFKNLLLSIEDCAPETTTTMTLEIPCPGRAHESCEECLICDADNDGRIEVMVTNAECDALQCATNGLPFDAILASRLVRLGLLMQNGGTWSTTTAGLAFVTSRRFDLN